MVLEKFVANTSLSPHHNYHCSSLRTTSNRGIKFRQRKVLKVGVFLVHRTPEKKSPEAEGDFFFNPEIKAVSIAPRSLHLETMRDGD